MLSLPASFRVSYRMLPCDSRCSFDRLSMAAEHIIWSNPFSGHLTVYYNRRANRLKITYWDWNRWAICYKRFEAGTSSFRA